MPLPQVIITGNLTRDPEIRFTQSGTAVATFSVASQDRKRDADGNWVDGDTTFLDVTAWRQTAENVGDSLSKGDRVVVYGRLRQRSYETKQGEKRTVLEVEADEVGPSLYRAKARLEKANKGSAPVDKFEADPWATDAPAPF